MGDITLLGTHETGLLGESWEQNLKSRGPPCFLLRDFLPGLHTSILLTWPGRRNRGVSEPPEWGACIHLSGLFLWDPLGSYKGILLLSSQEVRRWLGSVLPALPQFCGGAGWRHLSPMMTRVLSFLPSGTAEPSKENFNNIPDLELNPIRAKIVRAFFDNRWGPLGTAPHP